MAIESRTIMLIRKFLATEVILHVRCGVSIVHLKFINYEKVRTLVFELVELSLHQVDDEQRVMFMRIVHIQNLLLRNQSHNDRPCCCAMVKDVLRVKFSSMVNTTCGSSEKIHRERTFLDSSDVR